MRSALWRDGRLSWPVVGAVVFGTLSLIALDLAWRLVKLQFDTFLIYAVCAVVAAAVLVLVAARLLFNWRRSRWPGPERPD